MWSANCGTSLPSSTKTMTEVLADIGGVSLSVAVTDRAKTGVVSKSRAAALTTVIWPVWLSMAKAVQTVPADNRVGDRLTGIKSVAVTVPTRVPSTLFSATKNRPYVDEVGERRVG